LIVDVIHGGNVDSFDYLAFPTQNPNNQVYIQNQLANFSQSLTDIGRKFIETSQAIYEKVNDSNTIRIAKAAVRMAKGMFHPNEIVQLKTLEEFRFAQPIMQRYIMAEPGLRELYHKQQVDGYSDSYADVEPAFVGVDHYDYRRVTDGIIEDTVDENGEDTFVCRNYFEDLRPDDVELSIEDKSNILSSWDLIRMFRESGQDPTDPFAHK